MWTRGIEFEKRNRKQGLVENSSWGSRAAGLERQLNIMKLALRVEKRATGRLKKLYSSRDIQKGARGASDTSHLFGGTLPPACHLGHRARPPHTPAEEEPKRAILRDQSVLKANRVC